ncbi:MAG: AAA family ATPase [Candidatus Ventricola sp.]
MVCILVTGLPATGKSTMAAYLSGQLGIPMFSKDAIKERLFDKLGFSSREEKVQLGVAAMEILYDCARACLSCGQSVILENNFEDVSREGLAALFAACPCDVITVQMTGDLRAIYRRFAQRDQSPERHRGHVVNDCYPEKPGSAAAHRTMPYEAFAAGMLGRGMDRLPWDGPCLRVDTTDFEKVDREAVLSSLRALMAQPENP